jgi:hypothetical protein
MTSTEKIYAYAYEHTDDFLDLHPLKEEQIGETDGIEQQPLFSSEFVRAALSEFRKLGWEGNLSDYKGIRYFLVPDFMVSGRKNSYGTHPVLYVKQDNHGTEFFASTKPLPGLE